MKKWRQFAAISGLLYEKPFYFSYDPNLSVDAICESCKQLKKDTGDLSLVIVDGLKSLTPVRDSAFGSIISGDESEKLKRLSVELDIIVLLMVCVEDGEDLPNGLMTDHYFLVSKVVNLYKEDGFEQLYQSRTNRKNDP